MIKVNCQECGKEFEAKRTSAKFCSANCRVKFNSRIQDPKEAQKEPETEKVVESTQNELKGLELNKIAETNTIVEFTYDNKKIDSIPTQPMEFVGRIAKIETKQLVGDSNSKFDQLLKQFNSLVDLTDKPKDIKLKLEQIKETVKNSNLTPRQTDSIVDRVNFYLNNQYGKAKHSLILG